MIKSLLKIGLLVVAGLIGYNYFFGTPEEKAQSREIVGKATDLGRDAWNLLKSERVKLQEGKYDDAIEKLEGLYRDLATKAEELKDSDAIRELGKLSERRAELEELLKKDGGELSEAAKRQLDDLTADTEELMNEMEAKGKSSPPQ
jgi:gas vesicle protein